MASSQKDLNQHLLKKVKEQEVIIKTLTRHRDEALEKLEVYDELAAKCLVEKFKEEVMKGE